MQPIEPSAARAACESILEAEKRYNIEHGILPSEIRIIDHLLARGLELQEAYAELQKRLEVHPKALWRFLRLLLSCAAHWSEPRLGQERQAARELKDLNRTISEVAEELATLLERRSRVRNSSAFSDNTLYHPVELIKEAARGHYRFERWVKEPLDSLCSEFDLKYWPGLDDLLNALAQDAAGAEIVATDPLTRAATECGRAGLAAVIRALLAGIEEQKGASDPSWPADFRPTDATLATLMSAALNLGPEELVGAEYVKRLRQRYRDNGRKQSEP